MTEAGCGRSLLRPPPHQSSEVGLGLDPGPGSGSGSGGGGGGG